MNVSAVRLQYHQMPHRSTASQSQQQRACCGGLARRSSMPSDSSSSTNCSVAAAGAEGWSKQASGNWSADSPQPAQQRMQGQTARQGAHPAHIVDEVAGS